MALLFLVVTLKVLKILMDGRTFPVLEGVQNNGESIRVFRILSDCSANPVKPFLPILCRMRPTGSMKGASVIIIPTLQLETVAIYLLALFAVRI